MTIRHRRRSVHTEAIAPWVTLSVILLIWWAGAKTITWVSPGIDLRPFNAGVDPDVRKRAPVDQIPPEAAASVRAPGPTISANTMVLGSDLNALRARSLAVPVRGLEADDLVSSFHDARGSRRHEAIDV